MHYRTPRIRYSLGPLDDFLGRHLAEPVVRHAGSSLDLSPASLPARRTIAVLEPLLD